MFRRWMAVLAAGLAPCAAQAETPAGLTPANYVGIADAVSTILDTSSLAYSTMMIGALAPAEARSWPAGARPAAQAPEARSVETACPDGGSAQVSLWDGDGDGELSPGDHVSSVFSSCSIGAAVLAGRSDFVVAGHRYEGGVEVTELEFRFQNFGTAALRWTGPARTVLRTDERRGTEMQVVTYRDLEVTSGSRRMRWNFTLDMVRPPIGSMVAAATGALSIGKLPLDLRQDEPFVIAEDGFPRSGRLTAADTKGARLQLEAGGERWDYRLFRAGNFGKVADSSSQSEPYELP